MVNRLAPLLAFLLFGAPAASFALGLGEIDMQSALNQPLKAEIALVSVQSGDLENLTIRLAPVDDFERLGVERLAMLNKLQFSLEQRPNGAPYVKVISNGPITEPYLDFIVEARWPRGRVLREYTMLIDPPTLTQEAPAPVQAPSASAPAAGSAPTTSTFTPSRPTSIPERAELRPAVSRDGTLSYGPVQRNDTLWDIANQLRPNQSVSVEQVMLALVRDNPQAFYFGNVNNLKAGYVLRIRDAGSIDSISEQQATAEVARHHAEWQARKSGRPVMQADAGAAAPQAQSAPTEQPADVDAAAPAAAEQDARLRLSSAGAAADTSGGGDVAKLRDDLVLATEALDANRQETEDLKQRLNDLEEQLTSMQRLVELKDEEMQALQNQLREQEAAAPAPAQQAQTAQPQAQDKDDLKALMDDLMALEPDALTHPYVLAAAAILILLVLIGVIAKRRRMQQSFQESILNVGGGAATATVMTSSAGPVSGLAESTLVSDFSMAPMEAGDDEGAEVDPISEADVYLAYGRHQQAEDILRSAMDMDPDRLELHVKLLEVLHAAKRRESFAQQAQEFHNKLGGNEADPMWEQVVTMGRELCPHNALFGGTSTESMKEELEAGLSNDEDDLLDFDFDLDDHDDLKEEVSARHGKQDDNSLDFAIDALDFDLGAGTDTDKGGKASESRPADESALDLDIGEQVDNSIEFEYSPKKPTADADLNDAADDMPMAIETTSESDPAAEDSMSADDVSMILNLQDEDRPKATEIDTQELELTYNEERPDLSLQDNDSDDLDLDLDMTGNAANETEADLTGTDVEAQDFGGEDIFAEVDEVGTKLDLAKAYVDMGDSQGARYILDEVLEEGNDSQKEQAQELLRQIG